MNTSMVESITIKNFKSIEDLTLPLGRVTTLIGENGSGKSNILEAVAFLGAAAAEKLDSEFLISRGIRVSDARMMCSAFNREAIHSPIEISAENKKHQVSRSFLPDDREKGQPIRWLDVLGSGKSKEALYSNERHPKHGHVILRQRANKEPLILLLEDLSQKQPIDIVIDNPEIISAVAQFQGALTARASADKEFHLSGFLIYSPEVAALRKFEEEGQIQPLGIRGEGLFKMLQYFGAKENGDRLNELKESMELIGWFLDFQIPQGLLPGEHRLHIRDRYLPDNQLLDQRCANEGFLFLLFYLSLFLSPSTPNFFAIDNVDAALNPSLCAELMKIINRLAKKFNKQVILTTHNPAILDGIDLKDDEQRLLVASRSLEGRTKIRRINPPATKPGETPLKLSSAFLRGILGGLPKNF
ncbi:MAG: AAA family ATPase [Verrucomicrobiales bacterium]